MNLDKLLSYGFVKTETEYSVKYLKSADEQMDISVVVGPLAYSKPRSLGSEFYIEVEVAFIQKSSNRFIHPKSIPEVGQNAFWEGELFAYLPTDILYKMLDSMNLK